MMIDIEYPRKPSKPMLLAAIRNALNEGGTFIELIWGENRILIESGPYGLLGSGWIGKNGGDDLAKLI